MPSFASKALSMTRESRLAQAERLAATTSTCRKRRKWRSGFSQGDRRAGMAAPPGRCQRELIATRIPRATNTVPVKASSRRMAERRRKRPRGVGLAASLAVWHRAKGTESTGNPRLSP